MYLTSPITSCHRRVIHVKAPFTIESYYQQAGRAGRDGKPAECHLWVFPDDVEMLHNITEPHTLSPTGQLQYEAAMTVMQVGIMGVMADD